MSKRRNDGRGDGRPRRPDGGSQGAAPRGGASRGGSSKGGRRDDRRRDREPASDERHVFGLHPVRELLRAEAKLKRLYVAGSRGSSEVLDEILDLAFSQKVQVVQTDRHEIDELAGDTVHQGVLAVAPPFAYAELETVLAHARERGEHPLLVVLDGITDPHNLGSIARTAEAAGAHALVVPSRRSASVTPTAEKAAAGALAHLPLVRVPNLVRALKYLRSEQVWVVGLEADAPDTVHDAALLDDAVAIVVGSEGKGLARLSQVECDLLVNLPMRGRVGSLNASVAAAIALYEVVRRRGGR